MSMTMTNSRAPTQSAPRRLAQIGGGLAVLISVVIILVLGLVAHEGLNLLNLATLIGGMVGGGVAVLWPQKRWVVALGGLVILLAMVPALIGGVGLLYFPSVVALELSAILQHRKVARQRGW